MDFDDTDQESLMSTSHCTESANVGDIRRIKDGTRKKFNGTTWRRLCSKLYCEHYIQRQGLCKLHSTECKKRKISKKNQRKCRSIRKPNRRLSIASIPQTVDIDHPNKGDMIEMENGSHKKFDGVVWRTICSIENCFIAARRNKLCRKHFFQFNNRKESTEYDEKICSATSKIVLLDNENHSDSDKFTAGISFYSQLTYFLER